MRGKGGGGKYVLSISYADACTLCDVLECIVYHWCYCNRGCWIDSENLGYIQQRHACPSSIVCIYKNIYACCADLPLATRA